ncbi:MAG: nuclear transport factor 2 family protein [Nitriliruptorales bacterium]|nr:nuclear transport factor 2 family protein [Nitriliruptorales bacterium]
MVDREMILEQYRREVTPELYDEIRELYKTHSVAEDNRDIDGLLSTLTDDCVYEMPQSGHRWEGHEGAERFYTELLSAFPDIDFQLRNIVIGPQGVFEEADVSGTRKGEWLGVPPDDEAVEFRVLIFFPWDLDARKFRGEIIYVDSGDPTDVAAG